MCSEKESNAKQAKHMSERQKKALMRKQQALSVSIDKRMYSINEVAFLLDISRHEVSAMITEQVIPAIRMDGIWHIPRAVIRGWLEENALTLGKD